MIPKIIHSVWFGRGPKSALFAECVENQQRFARDNGWEFRETNEDTLGAELMETPFMRGVLGRGEYVKATVVGRYAALAREGGVYLDCDVEIVRPFGELLELPFFAGWEDDHYICDAVLGSVPAAHHLGASVAELLHGLPLYSEGEEGPHAYGPTYLTRSLRPLVIAKCVQPPEVFYPSHWRTPHEVHITERTVTIHRWAASWVKK